MSTKTTVAPVQSAVEKDPLLEFFPFQSFIGKGKRSVEFTGEYQYDDMEESKPCVIIMDHSTVWKNYQDQIFEQLRNNPELSIFHQVLVPVESELLLTYYELNGKMVHMFEITKF